MQILRIGVLVVGVALFVGLTSCGGDDEKSTSGTSRATTSAGAATNGAAETTGATSVRVTAKDFSFNPDTFGVAAGKEVTVTLNNEGSATHTLTVYKDEAFTKAVSGADTKNVSGASKGEFTTTFAAGEYYFRCERHPTQMQGEFDAE